MRREMMARRPERRPGGYPSDPGLLSQARVPGLHDGLGPPVHRRTDGRALPLSQLHGPSDQPGRRSGQAIPAGSASARVTSGSEPLPQPKRSGSSGDRDIPGHSQGVPLARRAADDARVVPGGSAIE
jgi:hypothetical protein